MHASVFADININSCYMQSCSGRCSSFLCSLGDKHEEEEMVMSLAKLSSWTDAKEP
eukprot:c38721_g1_i1 orf=54-221(+)